jgi:hypothetical protein
MRRILAALKAMVRAIVRMVDGTWKFVFGSGGGGGDYMIDDDDYAPDPAEVEKSAESVGTSPAPDEHLLRLDQRRDASLVRIHAMKAVMSGVRPAIEPCLPRSVREWLPGLSVGELKMLADATPDQVRAHLNAGPFIQGLYRIQRLQPVRLLMKTGPVDRDEPRDVSVLRPSIIGL